MSPEHHVLLPILFLSQLLLCSGQDPSDVCHFNCGRLGRLYYPFSSANCSGPIAMNCTGSEPKARFRENGKWYPVNNIDYLKSRIEIHDQDLQSHLESNRCDLLGNFTEQAYLKSFKEELAPFFISFNITETRPFFKCKHKSNSSSTFFKQFDHYNCTGNRYDLYYNRNQEEHLPSLPSNSSANCSVVHLPAARILDYDAGLVRKDKLTSLWGAKFTIEWEILQACVDCFLRGTFCERPLNQSFRCYKKDQSGKKGDNVGGKIAIGLGTVSGSILLTCIAFIFYARRKENRLSSSSALVSKGKLVFYQKTVTTRTFEEFTKHQASFSPKRYNFKEIMDMTQSFKNKLGQGGYGSVFKGVLNDGKLVAVKVLSEIKGNGEEFINEVASISRTSHVNIVSLLGYCFEGSKRALIYEFMPNGSLDKYIYDKDSSVQCSNLGWVTLHEISVGIARGLEYLHRGCSTRILHFDIKPHNILLDQDFCPKIFDFGLAKLCPGKDSIISMVVFHTSLMSIAMG